MLDAIKRLMSGKASEPEWPEVQQWAKEQHLGFKRVRDNGGGFVIDGGMDSKPWRMEYGEPQRQYIQGHELRLRMELGLSQNLQMLILSQPLFEVLERATFESFTESTQTVIDHDTPEEMRWLVMFPKASWQAPKPVRQAFHVVGSSAAEAAYWVEGALAQQLELSLRRFMSAQPPFVLMVLRGRVYLRLQVAEPTAAVLSQTVALFETAVLQAVRTAAGVPEGAGSFQPTGGSNTAWQSDLEPDDKP
ncbi:MAG: hypothetical protein RLZZ618_4177 [Pseudomonadota bacterium]|jgi:hypothetical protein